MIPSEQAKAFIASKAKPVKLKSLLEKFSKSYMGLGKIIAQIDVKNTDHYRPIDRELKEFKELFGKDPNINPWESKEGQKLAKLLFGTHQGTLIAEVWEMMNLIPYQEDYNRRSFRSKPNDTHTQNKINTLQQIYRSGQSGFSELNFLEMAQYDTYKSSYYNKRHYLIAAALNNKEESGKLQELIKDIFQGEDEIGAVTGSLVKGLLLTDDPENWKLVESLLLAAQRQEGLRQTILEALDETSLGAIQYFIKVILDNNLMRFSSVVRAIDTWFGFVWEAPKVATIKRVLNFAYAFFEDDTLIKNALNSKDNLEVYVALWFMGLKEVDTANLAAIELLKNGKKEKKILAGMFIRQTGRTNSDILKWLKSDFGNDLETDFWAMNNLPKETKMDQNLFDKILTSIERVPSKGKKCEGLVFAWSRFNITRDFFYQQLILVANEKQIMFLAENLAAIPSESRQLLMQKIFPDHYGWYYGRSKEKKPKANFKKDSWKREVVYQAIRDRNEAVMGTALRLFHFTDLDKKDISVMEDMLARKSKLLRETIIKLIIKQEKETVKEVTSRLITSSKVEQRLAALEVLSIQYEQGEMLDFVNDKITSYSERPKLSKNEQVFLDKCKTQTAGFSFANGFGIINYDELSPLIQPQLKFGKNKSLISKLRSNKGFLFSKLINSKKTIKAVNKLIELYKENQNHEYETIYKSGEKQFLLLGKNLQLIDHKAYDLEPKKQLEFLPLVDLWKKWYEQSKLNDFELLAAIHFSSNFSNPYRGDDTYTAFQKQYIPDLSELKLQKNGYYWDSINNKISGLLRFFYLACADHSTMLQFHVDVLEDMIVRLPESIRTKKSKTEIWNYQNIHWSTGIESSSLVNEFFNDQLEKADLEIAVLKRYWQLLVYLAGTKLVHPKKPESIQEMAKVNPANENLVFPPTWLSLQLYNAGEINDADFQYACLLDKDLIRLIEGQITYKTRDLLEKPIPRALFRDLKANLLTLELDRGDLKTEASLFCSVFSKIEGSHYLFNLLGRLGKETFSRGYFWGAHSSKKESFSNLVKKCVPAETEEINDFIKIAKTSKLPKKRWIEVAVYAPQWASWIGAFLGISKLEDAVWWFHAHTSDYMNAEKETLISRYSNIEKEDFAKGAIDLNWFNEVYASVGKQNWKLLHDAAKYISPGNSHRLVKLYSGVMLGEVKIRETLAKIKDKRDKDYLKALGLIPLSKANRKKDLLTRYNLLQDFLKESKQFGSQRQESEKNAVHIALDNLSRNAGFDDSVRFSWAMEGAATQKIMDNASVKFDDTTLQLMVDEEGKAEILVTKNGKSQKSIPAKYKKEKAVKSLLASKSYLKKQYKRTRLSLENAMLQEEAFLASEINEILKHPVVKALLSKLVLYNKKNNQSGFWNEKGLKGANGKIKKIKDTDYFVIAHPSHLYQNVEWDLYQKMAFDHSLVQPFKQIFRELYVITKNEKETTFKSERYQGHQIQPQKTVALLRGRGWTVSHEEGLQKVYHKKGYIATMYAMADWYSPADIEAPTLEYVCFYSRKDYKPIALQDVDPVTFSEIMRDVDLVVSVAHVGGVDPEASHSTMEMRGVLARESARLFKADNVEVKERHIIIKGKLADYSIHLGSGVVSINGLRLSIIPVHSQHRGRLFLPFVDDDPKTAEIISKMKLLIRDNEIKDPTILAQINQ